MLEQFGRRDGKGASKQHDGEKEGEDATESPDENGVGRSWSSWIVFYSRRIRRPRWHLLQPVYVGLLLFALIVRKAAKTCDCRRGEARGRFAVVQEGRRGLRLARRERKVRRRLCKASETMGVSTLVAQRRRRCGQGKGSPRRSRDTSQLAIRTTRIRQSRQAGACEDSKARGSDAGVGRRAWERGVVLRNSRPLETARSDSCRVVLPKAGSDHDAALCARVQRRLQRLQSRAAYTTFRVFVPVRRRASRGQH